MTRHLPQALCALFILLCAAQPLSIFAHQGSTSPHLFENAYDPFAEDDDPFGDDELTTPTSRTERFKQWCTDLYYKAKIGMNVAHVKARRWWHNKAREQTERAARASVVSVGVFSSGASLALLLGHLYNSYTGTDTTS